MTEEDVIQIPTLEDRYNNDPMANIHITADMVLKKLKKLRNNKSAGPDGINRCIMKETAEAICNPLALIFNKSLQEGQNQIKSNQILFKGSNVHLKEKKKL